MLLQEEVLQTFWHTSLAGMRTKTMPTLVQGWGYLIVAQSDQEDKT